MSKGKLTTAEKLTLSISVVALFFSIPSLILSVRAFNEEYQEKISLSVQPLTHNHSTAVEIYKVHDSLICYVSMSFECTVLNNSSRQVILSSLKVTNDHANFSNPFSDENGIFKINFPIAIKEKEIVNFYIVTNIRTEGKAKDILIRHFGEGKHRQSSYDLNDLLYKNGIDLVNNVVEYKTNRSEIDIESEENFDLTIITASGNVFSKKFGFYSFEF